MNTIPLVLMAMGAAFMIVGFFVGILTFLQMTKDMIKPINTGSDEMPKTFFSRFYRYAVCVAVFGSGAMSAFIGLVWYLVSGVKS